ncbi:nucleotide pyrophosphohydrolase [bacterium]|jgi:dCTP diphosphatase|nr:nucleotide pyrophosphohydrolase [bacterium]MBT3903904.1 nucleotide pyrophosphohydrolase [bacterium]MBT4577448.1 nucleotide pyrophosphohydrolase [bacterium]MBT5345967.1 nucleotide pyrophosphohydrolase [bacterium]MBT6130753.1 nucleotide pyrophosphohydrolase [bacterium]
MDSKATIQELRAFVDAFVIERNWKPMHTPASLATAISLESSELLQIFQWSSPEDGPRILKDRQQEISDEVADVAITLIAFCNITGLDLDTAVRQKLAKQALKYPVVSGQNAMNKQELYSLVQAQRATFNKAKTS